MSKSSIKLGCAALSRSTLTIFHGSARLEGNRKSVMGTRAGKQTDSLIKKQWLCSPVERLH